MDLITWEKFLNLSNDAPIRDAIKLINSLSSSINAAVSEISSDSERLAKDYKTIADESKKMFTEVGKLNVTLQTNQELIVKSAKATDELAVQATKNQDLQKQGRKTTEDLTKATKDLSKAKEHLLKGQSSELGSISALKAQIKDAQKAYEGMGKASSQAVKDEQLQKLKSLSSQYNEAKRAIDQAKKSTTLAAGSYNELNQRVIESKKRLKELAGGVDQNSKEFKELQADVRAGTQKLKDWDAAILDNGRNVGNYKDKLKGLTGQLLGAAGVVAGIAGAVRAFKSLISTNSEYEKSLDNLQAITGASAEDLDFYSDAARTIGPAMKTSATQTIEAFKLIGSAKPELLQNKEALVQLTKEAMILSQASGDELPVAAENLAAALNSMNLPAEESGRVINVLAAASQKGAKEIPFVNEALAKFGGVADSAGVSIETSVSAIETLGQVIPEASVVGNNLKNVLIILQTQAAKANRPFEGLSKELERLAPQVNDITFLEKTFGRESLLAAQTLIRQRESLDSLEEGITGTNTAYEQAITNTDNLQGDTDELVATVESLTIQMGTGLVPALRNVVQFFTAFVHVIAGVPAFVQENKVAILALGTAIIGLKLPLIISTALTLKDAAAKKIQEIATKAATLTTQKFFKVLAANPFGLILVAISALIAAIEIYDKKSKRSQDIQAQSVELNKELDQAIQDVKAAQQELNISIEDYNKLSPAQQKALRDEVSLRKQNSVAILEELIAKQQQVGETAKQLTGMQAFRISLIQIFKPLTDIVGLTKNAGLAISEFIAENEAAAESPFEEKINKLKEEIANLDNFLSDSAKADEEAAAKEEANSKERAKRIKDAEFELAKFKLQRAIKTQEEIAKNEANSIAARVAANLQAEKLRYDLIDLERKKDLDKEKLTQAEILLINTKANAERTDNEKEALNERKAIQLEEVQFAAEIQDRIAADEEQSFDDRMQATLESERLKSQILQAQRDLNLISEQQYADKLKDLEEKLTDDLVRIQTERFDKLNSQYNTQVNEQLTALNESFNKREITAKEFSRQRLIIQETSQKELLLSQLDFLKEKLQFFKKNGEDTTNLEEQISQVRLRLSEKSAEQELSVRKDLNQAVQDLAQSAENLADTAFAAETQRNIERSEQELAQLNIDKENRLRVAGEDAQARAAIEADFANKQRQIQRQIAAEKRKQALFDKARSASETIIATAKAVVQTLPNIPLSFLVGAIGALNLAKILATPIPAFWTGTTSSPEGMALVGERGPELAIDPQGQIVVYQKPQTTYLQEGTRIFNAKETDKIHDLMFSDDIFKTFNKEEAFDILVQAPQESNTKIIQELQKTRQEMVNAVAGMPQDYYDEDGYRRYERDRNRRVRRLDNKYKFN